MAVREAKNIKELAIESVGKRIQKLKERFQYWTEHLDEAISTFHIQPGNVKTGKSCWTVSLMPIIDCTNCSGCARLCYDIRNDCIYPSVIDDRARNSAIHKHDRKLYWRLVSAEVKDKNVKELRLNVGGDLEYEDFGFISQLASEASETEILFFTKNYNGLNKFLEANTFPSNVHPIMSAWPGMEMSNPFNVPCSHVLWSDGTTTAPKNKFSYACNGNCSECAMHHKANNKMESGCFGLEAGDNVVFPAH